MRKLFSVVRTFEMFLRTSLLIIGISNVYVDAMQGGQYTSVKTVPYMAQLHFEYPNGLVSFCGAAIISDRWVVSAAHCMGKVGKNNTQVRVGSSTTLNNGKLYKVSKIIVSEDYDTNTQANDIALIKTKKPMRFNEYQQPIPISHQAPRPGDKVAVSGFGDGHYNVEGQSLKKAKVEVIDNKSCNGYSIITDKMFCTSVEETDLCYGDSGSPAVLNGKLVGVASQGCEYTNPNVFTSVAKYYNWIAEHTGI